MKKTLKIATLSTLIMGFFASVASAKDISTYINEAVKEVTENQIYSGICSMQSCRGILEGAIAGSWI